jgi:hypothetical protein
MIRKQRLALVGMALLAAVSAAPAHAHTDDIVVINNQVVDSSMSQDQPQAAHDCEGQGGWYDAVAGVCDANGVK